MKDYRALFPSLPDESDAWVYAADSVLSPRAVEELLALLSKFAGTWSSHGLSVSSGFTMIDRQILVLSAFIQNGDISGCGIDKSLHTIDSFASGAGFEWLDSLSVVFRDTDGQIRIASRSEFKEMVKEESVTSSTIVLDRTVRKLKAIRTGQFEIAAGDSWHGRIFSIPEQSIAVQ